MESFFTRNDAVMRAASSAALFTATACTGSILLASLPSMATPFSWHHLATRFLRALFGTSSKLARTCPVLGHVDLPESNHRWMDSRSYVWPLATTTGSRIRSREMGQRKSGGGAGGSPSSSTSGSGLESAGRGVALNRTHLAYRSKPTSAIMAAVHLSEARSPISRSRLSISSLQLAGSLMPTSSRISSSLSRSGTISRSISCISDSTLALSACSAAAAGANRRHCRDESARRSMTSSARPSSTTGRRSSSVARSWCSSRTSSSISSDCSRSRIRLRAAQSAATALNRCSTRSTSCRHSDADRGRSPAAVHMTMSSNAAARSLERLEIDASAARRNGAGVLATEDRSRARRCSDRSSSPSDGDGGGGMNDDDEQPDGDGAAVTTVLGLLAIGAVTKAYRNGWFSGNGLRRRAKKREKEKNVYI
uniref:Uncharacterized protein n=1 Tax=Arundo donax TaxID=35708 RepID=A0A0A9H364_ARUDO